MSQAVIAQIYCGARIVSAVIEEQFGINFADYFARELQIMRELEALRADVTPQEVEETREKLKGKKVPVSSKVWRLKEPAPVTMRCMRCGHDWSFTFDLAADEERMCPLCRNNSYCNITA